jgi:hypothetical protein
MYVLFGLCNGTGLFIGVFATRHFNIAYVNHCDKSFLFVFEKLITVVLASLNKKRTSGLPSSMLRYVSNR